MSLFTTSTTFFSTNWKTCAELHEDIISVSSTYSTLSEDTELDTEYKDCSTLTDFTSMNPLNKCDSSWMKLDDMSDEAFVEYCAYEECRVENPYCGEDKNLLKADSIFELYKYPTKSGSQLWLRDRDGNSQKPSLELFDQDRKVESEIVEECDKPFPCDETETTLSCGSNRTGCNDIARMESDASVSSCSPEIFSYKETFIIFDWDDTLLPSTWLSGKNITLDSASYLSPEVEAALSQMSEITRKTLEIASLRGRVIIVTNAENGWVQLSCEKFFPSLLPYLRQFYIVSARSIYSNELNNDPSTWKKRAFLAEISRNYDGQNESKKNVLSIGDSVHERLALLHARETLHSMDLTVKSIKFIDRPCVKRLQSEHEIIQECLADLVQFDGALDLAVKILTSPETLNYSTFCNSYLCDMLPFSEDVDKRSIDVQQTFADQVVLKGF